MQKSVFDPEHQHGDINSKIVFSLERISQVFRLNLWQEYKKYGLSPIQVQILIFLKFKEPKFRVVSRVADEFNLSKPTVSDAIRTLEQKGLLSREPNPKDKRSPFLNLTDDGNKLAGQLSLFANNLHKHLSEVDSGQKKIVFKTLTDLILKLQENNVITNQRMCMTCRFFKKNNAPQTYNCEVLDLKLMEEDIRVDCSLHNQK